MPCNIKNPANIDLSELEPHIHGMYDYFDQKIGFNKPPTMVFDSDPDNQHQVLGKTAYYDPSSLEIHVYSDGRHPKDMLRSIAHELIHHRQNLEGRLDVGGYHGEGYYLENKELKKLEHEAMLKGNALMREYEDTLKRKEKKEMSLNEWKNNELNRLLMKKFGILKEEKEITHMCALEVTHKASGQKGHPIKHTLSESGQISHYTVEFDKVIVENIAVENLDIVVQEEHKHKRDDEKEHDKDKPVVSEEELQNPKKADLNKDGKLSGYEKKRGKAIEKSMAQKNEEKHKTHTMKEEEDDTSKMSDEDHIKAIEKHLKALKKDNDEDQEDLDETVSSRQDGRRRDSDDPRLRPMEENDAPVPNEKVTDNSDPIDSMLEHKVRKVLKKNKKLRLRFKK